MSCWGPRFCVAKKMRGGDHKIRQETIVSSNTREGSEVRLRVRAFYSQAVEALAAKPSRERVVRRQLRQTDHRSCWNKTDDSVTISSAVMVSPSGLVSPRAVASTSIVVGSPERPAGLARRIVEVAQASSFPTTAERFIELHQALVLVVARLCQGEFGSEQRPLAVKDREVRCGPAFIEHERHLD